MNELQQMLNNLNREHFNVDFKMNRNKRITFNCSKRDNKNKCWTREAVQDYIYLGQVITLKKVYGNEIRYIMIGWKAF